MTDVIAKAACPAQELVWLEDAAMRRGISIRTLYRLRNDGLLTFHRRRGCSRVLVDVGELAVALKARPVKSRAKPA